MTCPNCGAENNDAYLFCQRCGTRLSAEQPQQNAPAWPQQSAYSQPQQSAPAWPQQSAPAWPQQSSYGQPQQTAPAWPQQNPYGQPQQEAPQYQQPAPKAGKLAQKLKQLDFKKLLPKNPKKLLVPGVIAVAVIAAVIVLLCLLPGGSGFGMREMNYYTYYNEDDEVAIFANGELLEEGLEFEVEARFYSLDGKVMCFLTDEGEAYVVRNGKISLLAEDVEMLFISEDGTTAAYITEENELMLADTKKLESTLVAEDTYYAALSPNGKTMVYSCVEDDEEEIYMYLYDGKKSEELAKDSLPLAVSNGGKVIYAYNGEKESIVAMDAKGDSVKIGSDIDLDDMIYISQDHTQIVYRADGKWYACVNGGEKIKLSSKISDLAPVTPLFGGFGYYADNVLEIVTVCADDLNGIFYQGDDALYFLNKKWELEKVDSGISTATISRDGKVAYYRKNSGDLCRVTAGNLEDTVEVAEDVVAYRVVSDGSAVYYMDDDDAVYYCKDGKDAKHLGDDVEYLYLTHDDIFLFIEDYSKNAGELYMSKAGGKKEHVMSDCYRVYLTSSVTYVATDYDSGTYLFTMYSATKGGKFELMYEP